MTGSSASDLRKDAPRLDTVIQELSRPPDKPGRKTLEVRLVSVEPFQVIASRHVGPPEGIFQTFGAFFRWAAERGIAGDLRGIYGVPIDDIGFGSPEECRFDCCFDFGPKVRPDQTRDKIT